MRHRGKACYGNKNRHTEDNSSKYRMVWKMLSILRSFANAQDDEKFACHPELGATHVATCVNTGSICTDYLKNFSGSINIDLKPSPEFLSSSPLTKKFNPLTKREGSRFSDKVFSRFTSHFSLKFLL